MNRSFFSKYRPAWRTLIIEGLFVGIGPGALFDNAVNWSQVVSCTIRVVKELDRRDSAMRKKFENEANSPADIK